jgi:hypothetical protein
VSHPSSLRSSHVKLLRDVSGQLSTASTSRAGRLDAIIVPASRPATFLRPAIELAAELSVPLLILCSLRARPEQVARRVAETPGARAHVVEVHAGWGHDLLVQQTSNPDFHRASAGRSSDLSLKRNLGLLLARKHGWNKVLFLDDDIAGLRVDDVARLAAQLDRHHVAGMVVRKFADNSVACHARRLAGLPQDNFVSGAVLGVNCADHPLSIFPDVYNEDWFFFGRSAAERTLAMVGEARQEEYAPFADPGRARREEFGDLLAEGLYALFEDTPGLPFVDRLKAAGREYWERAIQERHDALDDISGRLQLSVEKELQLSVRKERRANTPMHDAITALKAAGDQLNGVTPELCVNFLEAWQQDLARWQKITTRANTMDRAEAYSELGLKNVRFCSFGDPNSDERGPTAILKSEPKKGLIPQPGRGASAPRSYRSRPLNAV